MRAIAWRSLKRRRLRTFFTALAIALGVANVFGVFVTNDSMQSAVEKRARSATGGADAIASVDGRGWLNDDIDQLERLPNVRKFMKWGTYKPLEGKGRTLVYLQAVDLIASNELIDVRKGRLPRRGEPEVALTESAARLLGADIGDRVREGLAKRSDEPGPSPDPRFAIKRNPPGRLSFLVTGIIGGFPFETTDANFGSVTSLEYMWSVEEPNVVLELGFLLEDGVDVDDWTSDAEVAFPNLLFRQATGPRLLRDFLVSFRALLAGTAALALFIGAFLIYLIFTLSLAERTRMFGILHSVGATRRHVAAAVLREAFILGIGATIVGVVVGLGLASVLLRLAGAIGDLDINAPVRLSASSFGAAVMVGVLATLVGAAVPAIRAARMTPVDAVTGRTGMERRPRAWIVGLPLLVLGTAIVSTRGLSPDAIGQLAITSVLLGAIFVVPLGIGLVARTTKDVVTRLVPGSGIVVFRHLSRESGRSAYTLALVMLVLASVITLTTADRSLKANAERVIDARFGADLILYGPKVGELTDDLRRVRGISGATTISFGRRIGVVSERSETTNLVLIDPPAFFDIAGFPWQEGNDPDALRALETKKAVLVPTRLAKRQGLSYGGTVRLRWETKEQVFDIAGTYDGGTGPEIGVVASSGGSFSLDADAPSAAYMNFERGADRGDILRRMAPTLRKHGALGSRAAWSDAKEGARGSALGPYFAISGEGIKGNAREELDGYVRLFSAVIGVIVLAGALGMATALATSVVLRTRELGTIKAVGGTRSHIRRMILSESLLLVAAAYVLAIGLGALLSWLFIDGVSEISGSFIEVRMAWSALPLVAFLAVLIAGAAAYAPARRAMRVTPVEALRYE